MALKYKVKTTGSIASALNKSSAILRGVGIDVSVDSSVVDQVVISQLDLLNEFGPEAVSQLKDLLINRSLFKDLSSNDKTPSVSAEQRFENIESGFKSVLKRCNRMVSRLDSVDEKASLLSRVLLWAEAKRLGSLKDQFKFIDGEMKMLITDTSRQIEINEAFLASYSEFRAAIKEGLAVAHEILKASELNMADRAEELRLANEKLKEMSEAGEDQSAILREELVRDKANERLQFASKQNFAATNLHDNLLVNLAAAEPIMLKLKQVVDQTAELQNKAAMQNTVTEGMVSVVGTTLQAVENLAFFTKAVQSFEGGINDTLKVFSKVSGKVQENALKAVYNSTLDPQAVKEMFESIAKSAEERARIIPQLRAQAAKNREQLSDTWTEYSSKVSEADKKAAETFTFDVSASPASEQLGKRRGKSKKEAEQALEEASASATSSKFTESKLKV